MYRTVIKVCIVTLLIFSCSDRSKNINDLLKSNDTDKLVEAFYLIGEKRDTNYIKYIFENPIDARVSNKLKFKGISVYQSKMTAIKKITGISPPNVITYIPDPTIVAFYSKIVKEKQY